MRGTSCARAACLLAALLACAAVPAAAGGRRLQQVVAPATNVVVHDGGQQDNVHRVLWDLSYVPYQRLQARCGDLVQFRWNDPRREEGQTVALINATSGADALDRCDEAEPLTPPTQTGEHTEELLSEGTLYFVEPSNCALGQILVVEVSCAPQPAQEEVAASGSSDAGRPRGWNRGGTDASTARANAAARADAAGVGAPAPAPAAAQEFETESAVAAAPAPGPAAAA